VTLLVRLNPAKNLPVAGFCHSCRYSGSFLSISSPRPQKCTCPPLVKAIWNLLLAGTLLAASPDRVSESVLPALAYGRSCSSTVLLRSLADTPIALELEAHRSSGALVPVTGPLTGPLTGHTGLAVRLNPGEQASYQLEVDEETTGAWVKIREQIPLSRASPAVAVSGSTECHAGNQVRIAAREVAFPTRNPWFSGEVADLHGAIVSLINASEGTARVVLCYAGGAWVGMPGGEWSPVCSTTLDVQIPPFGSREYPLDRDGNSYFSIKTRGDALVLQMLRPAVADIKIYTVDSTIKFGGEVPDGNRPER
jgi:hypothetical protein